jgi:hypothetical protein
LYFIYKKKAIYEENDHLVRLRKKLINMKHDVLDSTTLETTTSVITSSSIETSSISTGNFSAIETTTLGEPYDFLNKLKFKECATLHDKHYEHCILMLVSK